MNSVTKLALGGLGLSAVGLGARVIPTLADSKKGSLTNRADCAGEHIKNDVKTSLQVGVPVGVAVGVGVTKPSILKTLATKTGALLGKVASGLGKAINKIAPKAGSKISFQLSKAATSLGKNAYKAGAVGLLAAGGLYVMNKLLKHAEQKGKIEQKYNDTGAIENATKNLVLNA